SDGRAGGPARFYVHALELRYDRRPLRDASRGAAGRRDSRRRTPEPRRRRRHGWNRSSPAHAVVAHLRPSLHHRRRSRALPGRGVARSGAGELNMNARASARRDELMRGIPRARVTIIQRIVAAGRRRIAGVPSGVQQRFPDAYFRGVGEQDLAQRSPETLAAIALHHLRLGRERAPGQTQVHVFNPDPARDGFDSPHTVVMVVTDDMPFLVDSLSAVFNTSGLAVHLVVHPVLEVQRERKRIAGIHTNAGEGSVAESWQLYEIDRQVEPQRMAELQKRIESVIDDVRVVVEDWKPMRERVRALVKALEETPPPVPDEETEEARRLLEWMEARHFVFLGYRHYRLE